MKLDFEFNIDNTDNKFCAILSGLCIGFSIENLKALDNIGAEIKQVDPSYKFPFIICTWETDWNKKWVDGIVKEAVKYENVELHLFTLKYDCNRFLLFINEFLNYTNTKAAETLSSNLFKILAVHFIHRESYIVAQKVTNRIDDSANWSGFKFNSNFQLPLSRNVNSNWFLNSIKKAITLTSNSFPKAIRYYMDTPLDCFIFPFISSSAIKENFYFTSINAGIRALRQSNAELAKTLAVFFRQNSINFQDEFNTLPSLMTNSNYPKDYRLEGQYIFHHLVNSTSTPTPFICNQDFFHGGNILNFRSPDMSKHSECISSKDFTNINGMLVNIESTQGIHFVLSKEEYQNINYNCTDINDPNKKGEKI